MYLPAELARFALNEFERGLQGLTDGDARERPQKADGSRMNSISWTVGHIAWHWLWLRAEVTGQSLDEATQRFRPGPNADPTPPPLSDVLLLLGEAKKSLDWLQDGEDGVLSRPARRGNVGTSLIRVVLHTWYHAGDTNAVRQLLGHPEIVFVGRMEGSLSYHSGLSGAE